MTDAPARERLVAAAQALYAERGVAATTPREVLERSAVGQGSLYHHFPTKNDLAHEAVGRTVAAQFASAAATLRRPDVRTDSPDSSGGLDRADDARGRLSAYLRRDRDAVAGCRVGRLTADPVVMAHGDLRGLVAGYFTDLVALVTEVVADTGLPSDRARERASAIVAVVQGGYVLSRATGDPSFMDDAVRGLRGLLGEDESDDEH